MPGTTTKLALYLPGGGSSGLITPDEQLDVDKINDNMKKIDTAIGFVVCTSGTRPATPFPGQSIVETDTRNTMYWNAVRWVPLDLLPNAASSTIRDVLYPTPVSGNQIFRTDLAAGGAVQIYSGTTWKTVGASRVPIVPVTVAGTGVSIVGNKVVFVNNLTDMNLYNIFTDDFEIYDITVAWAAATAVGGSFRLIDTASVIDINANYGNVRIYSNSTAAPVSDASLSTFGGCIPVAGINGNIRLRVTLVRAAQAAMITFEGSTFNAPGAGSAFSGCVRHNVSAVQAGIGFQFSGAATGTVQIEGVRI